MSERRRADIGPTSARRRSDIDPSSPNCSVVARQDSVYIYMAYIRVRNALLCKYIIADDDVPMIMSQSHDYAVCSAVYK